MTLSEKYYETLTTSSFHPLLQSPLKCCKLCRSCLACHHYDNIPAQKAYEALRFHRFGDYRPALLRSAMQSVAWTM